MTVTPISAAGATLVETAPATDRPLRLGDAGARLLGGPAGPRPEPLSAHLARLGPLPALERTALLAMIGDAGLGGRGGGGFAVARKLASPRPGAPSPLVIVNASESEPASRKDRTLCRMRPHLVLDGAAVAAAACGADDVVLYCHWSRDGVDRALRHALAERADAIPGGPSCRVVVGPDRYVAGEASAVASFVEGGPALPRFLSAPLAVAGIGGRPTVVHNAETLAHLGLLARSGPNWWREAGIPEDPGSRLVTVAGAVVEPGLVLEVVQPVTIGAALREAGMAVPPGAVLVGGYAGRWLAGETAWHTRFERTSLRGVGAEPGCGLLAALPPGACALAETARLAAYLAGQSAGQCGPCVFGLADVAESMEALASGRARRRDVRRLRQQLGAVEGRGGCHHPDGVAALVASALDAFAPDVHRHARGRPCPGAERPGVLPIPLGAQGGR